MMKALSLLVVLTLLQYSSGQVFDLSTDPTINEGNFGSTITISLASGGRPATPVVITFATSGTATAGLDYEAPGDFTYTTFGNDDQSFNLEISEDSIAELTETIILTASGAQFNTGTVTISITDDDVPFFRLTAQNVNEDVGSAVAFVELRATEIAFDVVVTVVTADSASLNSATAGADYTVTSVVLTFLSGNVEGATQNANIPINDDNLVEITEVFDVQLLVPGTAPPAETATIAIFDNDMAIFELFPSTSEVDEDVPGGQAQVSVRLAASSGELTFNIDVTIETTSGGTATVVDDYTAVTVIRTFTSGSNSGSPAQSLDIPITNDNVQEPTETIFVQGSESDASAQFLSGADTATVSILDDDVPNASFLPFPPSVAPILNDVNEAAGFALVRVELGGAILISAFEVTVQTIAGGSATAGADYTATTVVLTFMSGDGPGTTLDASIPILEDTLVEGPIQETISVELIAVGSSETGTVRITDNDVLTIAFQQSSYTVDENMTPLEVCVVIATPNSLDAGLTAVIQVDSVAGTATGGATATPPADYINVVSLQVTFTGPLSVGAVECFDVGIVDDSLDEPDEDFSLTLSPGMLTLVGSPGIADVTIVDDDDLVCSFTQSNYDVVEGNAAVITVQLLGTPSSDVMKQVSCVDDTAEPGDFTNPTPVTLSFPAGMTDTSRTVLVPTLDDNIKEADETILCTITILASGGQTVLFPNGNSATITILDNDVCTIGFIPPPGGPPFVGIPSYTVPEGSGPARIHVGIIAGGIESPREAIVTLTISDGTAQDPLDYTGAGDMVLTFDSTTDEIWLDVPIVDDDLCEDNETIGLLLTTSNSDVNLDPATGEIIIIDDDVAEVSLDQSSYTVWEHNESVWFNVSITGGVQKAPGQECEIRVYTEDVTATEGEDYVPFMETVILDDSTTSLQFHIDILDDLDCESVEQFYIRLESVNPNCNVTNSPIPVNILDDEDCCAPDPNRDPCHPQAICEEQIGPDNFTCFCPPPLIGDGIMSCMPQGPVVGDDPHFSIALPGGKLLCYTVQGEHGFTFNLISNEMVFMNALFVPDSRRDEVTWLGSMGISVKSGYRKSNSTALRFEALEKKIYINDKVVLLPKNVEKLTFSNGKLTISEAPPMEGFKYPKVYVDLQDVGLSFSIQFLAEHLDLFWHSTGQQTENSHGIIGQFFRKGVEIDEVRKILIMPNKEPVPVMRRPVWSFMEREKVTSDDQLCWTAMNPGYQGERLIDGTYFDYLVNDVLSTDFKFKK